MAKNRFKGSNKNHRKNKRDFMAEADHAARIEGPAPRRRKPLRALEAKTEAQGHYMIAIQGNQLTFGTGPAGTGKAQPLDAKILTPDGWVRMGSVKLGDKVIAHDGAAAEIVGVYPQGEKDIYEITFEDGRKARSCDEHLWRVYRYDWGGNYERVVPLAEIRRMLTLKSASDRLYIPLIQPTAGSDVALPVHPYILGALLGDGTLGKNFVRISSADDFIVEKVESLAPAGVIAVHYKGCDYGLVSGKGYSNPLLESIRSMSLSGTHSDTKFIPDEYMRGSLSQRIELLQGLMDTDGTVDKYGAISFTSVSERMANQVVEIVRSIGGIAKITSRVTTYNYKGEKKSGKTAYTVRIRLSDSTQAFSLPRKLERISPDYQYANLRLRIKSVELVGHEAAQCIAIDHIDHLYVTDDYVVTHNTYICTRMACEALNNGDIKKIIVTRPAVEASDGGMGFLPGDISEKFAPYFAPFRAVMDEVLGASHVDNLIKLGKIEIQPLEYIRGLTFDDAMVILDEAQNTTPGQMKLFLSRIGENARVVVNGDISQKDIPGDSGLEDAMRRLRGLHKVGYVEFTEDDIVRSGLVKEIIKRYRN